MYYPLYFSQIGVFVHPSVVVVVFPAAILIVILVVILVVVLVVILVVILVVTPNAWFMLVSSGIAHDLAACPPLLASLVTPGSCLPDIRPPLAQLLAAVDWDEVAGTLTVEPREGMDPDYDAAVAAAQTVQASLDACKRDFGSTVGVKTVKFVTLHKDPCVLEVPEVCTDWAMVVMRAVDALNPPYPCINTHAWMDFNGISVDLCLSSGGCVKGACRL